MTKPLPLLLLLCSFFCFQSCEKLEMSADNETQESLNLQIEGTYIVNKPLSFQSSENDFKIDESLDFIPTVNKVGTNIYDISWNHNSIPSLDSYEFKLVGAKEKESVQYVAINKTGDEGVLMFIIDKEKGSTVLSLNLTSKHGKYSTNATLKK